MDTNPFATPDSTGVAQQTPSYLQPTNNPTAMGGAANMIKALMAGNQKYQQMHPGGAMAGGGPGGTGTGDGQWMGNSSVGGAPLAGYAGVTPGQQMPMPPQQMPMPAAGDMQGGVPMPQPRPMDAPNPFMNGAPPQTVDPVTQALMSPIPGM